MSVRAGALLAVVASLAVACGGSSDAIRPATTGARKLSVRRGGFGSLLVRAMVDVTNPNPFSLELDAVDWELSIDGGGPVRGRSAKRMVIAARATAPVDLLIRLPPADAGPLTAQVVGGAGHIRISGRFYFESERGPLSLVFAAGD